MSWMIYGYRWDSEEPVCKWSARSNREVIGLLKTAVDNLQLDRIDVINRERFPHTLKARSNHIKGGK